MAIGTTLSAENQKLDRGAVSLLMGWILIAMVWWGFAFFPVNPAEPGWLGEAQRICFNKIPGQALSLASWIILFGGPLMLLIAVFVVYGAELKLSLQQIMSGPSRNLFLALLACFLAESIWVATRIHAEAALARTSFEATGDGSLPASYPRTAKPLPDFHLIDQNGRKVDPLSLKGRPTIFSFVFAHCATVCPVLVKSSLSALESAGVDAQAAFLTLDPWRDTPGQLPQLASQWKLPATSLLLSGPVAEVNAALEKFDVPRTRDEKSGDVTHPALVYVLDSQARIAYSFNNPSSRWLADALRILKENP